MTIINPDELDIARCLAIDTNTHLRIAHGIKDIIERDGIYSPLEILSEIRDYLADDNELVLATFIVFEIYISALQNEEPYKEEQKTQSMNQQQERLTALRIILADRGTVYTKMLRPSGEVDGQFECRDLKTGKLVQVNWQDIVSITGQLMTRQGQQAQQSQQGQQGGGAQQGRQEQFVEGNLQDQGVNQGHPYETPEVGREWVPFIETPYFQHNDPRQAFGGTPTEANKRATGENLSYEGTSGQRYGEGQEGRQSGNQGGNRGGNQGNQGQGRS